MIEIAGISKRFEAKEVLRNVDATVHDGEIFAIIGPSGSGKSTLLRIINLLEQPTGGRVLFNGTDIHAAADRSFGLRRSMGMVFQKPVAFSASVFENVAAGLRIRGAGEAAIRERVEEALEVIGLADRAEQGARTLSGGEMQRVAIARVLVTDPALLLMDEPTANLDPLSTETVEALIRTINREYGTTLLIATHDLLQGQRLADRMGVMIDGTFAQVGTPDEIFSEPRTRGVARFVGMGNIIPGRISAYDHGLATVEAGGRQVLAPMPLPVGESVHLCVRPEDVTLYSPGHGVGSARNIFEGTVQAIRALGPFRHIELDCGFPITALATWKAVDELGIFVGSDMQVAFKASAVHVVQDESTDGGARGKGGHPAGTPVW
jgi:tungstate transport system ATP-binding protein